MLKAVQLAGFLAAELIPHVAAGRGLSPIVIFEKADGSSHIIRIQEDDGQKAAMDGENLLIANEDGAERGVMAVDAYLNLPHGRRDALFLQAREYTPVVRGMVLALPYHRGRKKLDFKIHRLKIIAFEDESLPQAALTDAFFDGVAGNPKGARYWKENYDDGY